MLQDELSGVWFVLTVVHIHLELISLDEARAMNSNYDLKYGCKDVSYGHKFYEPAGEQLY